MYCCVQTDIMVSEAIEYKQEGTTDQSFLDPHHTHFILVDENENGSEIDFRAKFESRELYSGKYNVSFAFYDDNNLPLW